MQDRLILIDGDCVLCHKTAQFIERHSGNEKFYYSSLQSGVGKEVITRFGFSTNLDSILYFENNRLYNKSDAVLKIAKHLKFPFCLLSWLIIVPTGLRNWLYVIVAANRYSWFGKTETCLLPTKDLNSRVIED